MLPLEASEIQPMEGLEPGDKEYEQLKKSSHTTVDVSIIDLDEKMRKLVANGISMMYHKYIKSITDCFV
jgi:hypothetical protein